MTLFLGYFLLDEAAPRPELAGAEAVINRESLLSVRSYRGARHGVVVASGAFASPVAQSQDGAALTVLTGDPVWNRAESGAGASDVEWLHTALQSRSCRDVMAENDGVCCGLHLDQGSLVLFTDHIGAAPLYYAVVGRAVLFANCLRGVEYLGRGALSLNWSGVYQRIAFGHELGDATIYDGVRLLGAGEIVRFDQGEWSIERHADWEGIAEAQCTEEEAARAILDALMAAVEGCRRGSRRARAFLSGGMDSRLVTILLREAGVELETFNFSREGTLERLLARQFAAVLGSTHREEPQDLRAIFLNRIGPFAMFAARVIRAIPPPENETPEERWQGRRLWSGDSGSGHLGHVFIDRGMVMSFEEGGTRKLLENFPKLLRRVPERIFYNAKAINEITTNAFVKEIESYKMRYEKRRVYWYFSLNNFRRVPFSSIEDHDLHGIEIVLPFMNRKVLALIMSTPIEYCFEHKLYNKMMTLLPDWTKTVPWQSYPGHEPCPLPVPKDARDQWVAREAGYYKLRRQVWRERGWQAMRQPVGSIVKKPMLLAYLVADLCMGRDYGYIMQAVDHIASAATGRGSRAV